MELSQDKIIGEFNTVIGEIARAQARATKGIGKALVMCVYGSIVLKDAGMTEALTKCLRKSTKQTGIKAFIEHFGNVAFIKGEAQYFDAKREWTEEYKKEVIKASLAWEEFKPETAPEAIDVEAKLEAIVKAVTSANKTGREVKHAALVESIQTIIAEYHAAQFSEIE
jgi:hypothetical protein